MKALSKFVNSLSTAAVSVGAALAALILTAIFLLILVEITLRTFFGSSTHVVEELVGLGVAWATFLGLGYAFERAAIVRVEFLLRAVPEKPRRLLEIACGSLAMFCMGMIQYSLYNQIRRDYTRGYTSGTTLDIPSYFPKAIIFIGISVFMLALLSHIVRQLAATDRVDPSSH